MCSLALPSQEIFNGVLGVAKGSGVTWSGVEWTV